MIDYEDYLKEVSDNTAVNDAEQIKQLQQQETHEIYKKAAHDRHAKFRARDRAIKEEALNQTYINLNAPIEVENKQLLISLLVKGYVDKMKQYKDAVYKTVEDCFRQVIPNQVLKTWETYKDMCIPFPGFMYKCGKEYGQNKELFIEMDLPMYFRPDVCQGIFKENWPEKVSLLEKRIALYHYHRDVKIKTEVKYAKSLVTIQTYFQLLERKTHWYGILIEELKRQNKLDLDDDLF